MNLKIINKLSTLILLTFVLSSCGNGRDKLLCQKWKTVGLKNSTMDKGIKEMRAYIDTVGLYDEELRKTIDLDSAKKDLEDKLNKTLLEQKVVQESTFMEFNPNGVCYTISTEGIDSAMYSIEEGSIKIDEAKLKGFGETMTFEILKLTKDTLSLRMIDYGDTSVVTMIPIR
jgi:hypothetical protein